MCQESEGGFVTLVLSALQHQQRKVSPMDQPYWPIGARCSLLGCEISIGVWCEDPAPAADGC